MLRDAGLQPGPVLGAGMEGVVFALGADRVAKVWFERTEFDVNRLRAFYQAAARGSGLRLAQIEEVMTASGRVVSVEHRVAGVPVGGSGQPRIRPDDNAVRQLGDALAGLASIPPHPALADLPLLPGEPPAAEGATFVQTLASLIERRVPPVAAALDTALAGGLPVTTTRVLDELDALRPRRAGLVHGDLIPDNVLVDGTSVPGVIDFGFLTTWGDPDFDVAVSAAIFDMYGPETASTTALLTHSLASRFDTPASTIRTYRDAYALVTAGTYGSGPDDGHFRWCVDVLRAGLPTSHPTDWSTNQQPG